MSSGTLNLAQLNSTGAVCIHTTPCHCSCLLTGVSQCLEQPVTSSQPPCCQSSRRSSPAMRRSFVVCCRPLSLTTWSLCHGLTVSCGGWRLPSLNLQVNSSSHHPSPADGCVLFQLLVCFRPFWSEGQVNYLAGWLHIFSVAASGWINTTEWWHVSQNCWQWITPRLKSRKLKLLISS